MQKIKLHLIKLLLLAVAMFALPESVWADGSRDLYPSGATGYRAFLRSGTSIGSGNAFPYANRGTHYVYAKEGEVIMLASSAQGYGSISATRYNNRNNIQLFGPNGSQITLNVGATSSSTGGNVRGNIGSRVQELAGPSLTGQGNLGSTGTYKPIEYVVPAGGEGVYLVHFLALGNSDPSNSSVLANSNWSQGSNNSNIAAWDVSVRNGSTLIQGRVYFNTIGLSSGNYGSNHSSEGFYGVFYAMTKDGYYYKVNNNGMNGVFWQFYINNFGFVDSNNRPLYRSLNTNSPTDPRIPDPNTPDTEVVTHKVFYNQPASDMPEITLGARYNNTSPRNYTVGSGNVWLKKTTTVLPEVTDLSIVGNEGSTGMIGAKGGKVNFTSATDGVYEITITSKTSTEFSRTLRGVASEGSNSVIWDGADDAGMVFPSGNHDLQVVVTVQSGEVHFPFLDVEYNLNGIIIERVKPAATYNTWEVESDIVYWDDTDLPRTNYGPNPQVNLEGISSNINGHLWRTNGSNINNQYGNDRAIDTWAFIKSDPAVVVTSVTMKVADLEIVSIVSDNSIINQGQSNTYAVVVKNNGPDEADGAIFTFKIPEGFQPVDFTFIGNGCGEENLELVYDETTRTFTSSLNLPNQCEITYEITLQAIDPIPGEVEVEAAILRPNDVIDPDATNPDPDVPRGTSQEECENNGLGGECNNIKTHTITVNLLDPLIATPDINQIPQDVAANGNVLTNDTGDDFTLTQITVKDENGVERIIEVLSDGTTTEVTLYDENGNKAGIIVIDNDGNYTFTPESGYTGSVSLEYVIENKNGNKTQTTLTIEVIPAVDPSQNSHPIAQNDTGKTKNGVPSSGNVLSNDSNPEGGQLSVTTANQGGTAFAIGSPVTVSGVDAEGNPVANAGTLTLYPDGNYIFVPSSDFVGTIDPIVYTITNENGNTDTAELFISVFEDNGNTTFANDDAKAAPKGETMSGNTLTNDFDPEGDHQTLTSITIDGVVYSVPTTDELEVNIPGKGILKIDKDGNYTFVPTPEFIGTIVVEQTVCDDGTPEPTCDKATLYLTIVNKLVCFKPAMFDATQGLPSNVGISSLRTEESREWPSSRQSAWIVLESKTKGFVPNRLTQSQIDVLPSEELVAGMMVYNVTEDCLQINVDATASGWKCFNVQHCE